MKNLLIVFIVVLCNSCASTSTIEENVTCQIGKRKNEPTILIKSPHERKGNGAIFTEVSTVAIDSLILKKEDETLWHIANKDDFKVLAINYGKIPMKFFQIFPEKPTKPDKLSSGEYAVEVYFEKEMKEFNIVIE